MQRRESIMKNDDIDFKTQFDALCESYVALRQHCLDNDAVSNGEDELQEIHCPNIPLDLGDSISIVAPSTGERDVFIFSIINWNFRFQRPQHLAREIGKKTRVFYVEMEMCPVGNHITKVSENIYVVKMPMGYTGVIEPYSGIAKNRQIENWIENFYKFVDSISGTSQKTVVLQHPWWWQFAKHFAPEFQITFDCMDDISGFSNTTQEIISLENDLIESCDHLVVSSQALFDSTRNRNEPILVRNGCALEHFMNYEENETTVFQKNKLDHDRDTIHVGYVGALAEWFDIELMEELVSSNKRIQYHICGGVTYDPIHVLDENDNVTFYGEIPYSAVPGFIAEMDVMIIPFQLTPIIQACDPVKYYEHCIMGVPTVATQMPELFRAGEHVALSDNPKHFLKNILSMSEKGKNTSYQAGLKEYAIENSWERRAKHLWNKISDYPQVSVVILNYGNPTWSLSAIHSLTENGGNYPNMQIVLVDNGSTDENIEILENQLEILSSKVEIKFIINGENHGFAKGNNIGIEACDGEYIVLLNNDTYVSPGSLHSLVNHLKHNPNVGVVGPLTNNIGNEAKIFVDYPDVETMGRQAKRWLTGYRNMHTSLRCVAYFCVAFRAGDLEEFGYLNESYGRGMFEDDDHCNIIREKGFDVVLAEDAFVHHHLSATFNTIESDKKQALFDENKRVYESRWGEWVPHEYREQRPISLLG